MWILKLGNCYLEGVQNSIHKYHHNGKPSRVERNGRYLGFAFKLRATCACFAPHPIPQSHLKRLLPTPPPTPYPVYEHPLYNMT